PPICRPPSSRRWSAMCRIRTPCVSPSSVSASSAARRHRSPSRSPRMCSSAMPRCSRMRWKAMTNSRSVPMIELDALRARAEALHLHGLVAHWPEVATQTWVAPLLDWNWPKRCDRAAIEALMALDFIKEAANIVVVGPNGVGKSTLAQNIAHQALIHGHTVLFTSAGQLLGDLCALDSDSALRRRLRHYARPQLLVIDEVGYLSYSNRHADLMFELVSRRYQ